MKKFIFFLLSIQYFFIIFTSFFSVPISIIFAVVMISPALMLPAIALGFNDPITQRKNQIYSQQMITLLGVAFITAAFCVIYSISSNTRRRAAKKG